MQTTSKIELNRTGSDDVIESDVIHAGNTVGCKVAGSHLEGQFICQHGFLVLATEDTPYEESLHIHLLSRDFVLIDSVELSHGYTSGLYKLLQHTEDSLEFSFFGGDVWKLSVFDHPQRWSFDQMEAGVRNSWRRMVTKHYLNLNRIAEN